MGCATDSQFLDNSPQPSTSAVELEETPFFPQTDNFCGPAALATILSQSGIEVTFEELRPAIYIPDRRGSLQVELVAATRSFGRVPYRIEPSMSALSAELRAGRSVLVLQNLGFKFAPLWHYAVVVGYAPQEKRIVLRSGDRKRHVVPEARFVRSWQRGDYWGMVALRPQELPVVAAEDRYLEAVAAVESVGQHNVALQAYQAALMRWPESELALLGLGNAHYARGELHNAEKAYRDLVKNDPDHVIALNNLAQTLADQGCVGEAMSLIDTAVAVPNIPERLFASLKETKAAVSAMTVGACQK